MKRVVFMKLSIKVTPAAINARRADKHTATCKRL